MPELIIEFYSEEIPAGLQEWAAGHIEMMIAKDFKEANGMKYVGKTVKFLLARRALH